MDLLELLVESKSSETQQPSIVLTVPLSLIPALFNMERRIYYPWLYLH